MQSIFYHYTSAERYRSIESGGTYGEKTGLLPLRRVIHLSAYKRYGLPEQASDGAIYGLLSPMPAMWCKKTFHADEPLLETVLGDIPTDKDREIYLLAATALPTDDVYVMNYAPHLRPEYLGRDSGDDKIVGEVKRAYWDSRVPFQEYLNSGVSYFVPEVVCFSPIPLERVRVAQVYNKRDLINHVREHGGFLPHPPEPKFNREAFEKHFGGLLKPTPPSSPAPIPGCRGHLRLV